jgi:hypothetical protein
MSDSQAQYSFAETGLQYMITGRFAMTHRMFQVAGNLYHHGIEYLLKSYLLRTIDIPGIKTLDHDLVKIWDKVKAISGDADLSKFDDIIKSLNRFEKIRYPETVVREGTSIVLSVNKPPTEFSKLNPHRNEPIYEISAQEIDELLRGIIKLTNINITASTSWYGDDIDIYLPNLE